MSEPKFYLVLGPSGAGKSSVFGGNLEVDFLNRDVLLQKLSGHNDPARASHEAKLLARHQEAEFTRKHLEAGKSFATERTFTYATELQRLDEAKARGFETHALFIAAGDADAHVSRAQVRVEQKGHRVSEAEVRDIHEQSMRNLPLLIAAAAEGKANTLVVYDNSGKEPTPILAVQDGLIRSLDIRPPDWFRDALQHTPFRTSSLRSALHESQPLASLDVDGPARRRAMAAELDPTDVIVGSAFARSLTTGTVLNDMQTVRERLLQGREDKEILSELGREHHRAAGSKPYAQDVLTAVKDQTSWSFPERGERRSDSRPELAVRITEPQANALLKQASSSPTELLLEGHTVGVLDGRAEVGFSHNRQAFYAVVHEGSEAAFRAAVSELQSQAEVLPTIRRQAYPEPDRAAAQERVATAIEANPEPFFDAYRSHPQSMQGRYICSDLFKETFSEFAASPEGRARYNNPLHNSAAVLAAAQLDRVLREHNPERNQVLFLTGVPGAGKTSAVVRGKGLEDNQRAIYEGQLSDPKAAGEKLQAALDAGLKPVVLVVNTAPEFALQNTLARFEREGRGASLHAMARIQSDLPKGLAAIRDTFGDRVQFAVFDRSRGLNNSVQLAGWDKLSRIEAGSYDDIHRRLFAALEEHHRAGTISEDAYRQARGQSTLAGRSAAIGQDASGPQQLPARGVAEQKVGALRFWQESAHGMTVKHAAGRLQPPDEDLSPRDVQAQRNLSRGTGYDAGHLIGHEFGGPEIPANLGLQNHIANQGGGTWYNQERNWANLLNEGNGVFVHVTEYTRENEPAFFYRRVDAVITSPSGEVTREESLFANPETARVLAAEGRSVPTPDQPGVILPLPQRPEPPPQEQEIGVLVTDNQVKLLLKEKNGSDHASYLRDFMDAHSAQAPVVILDGRAELDFDPEQERFYVALFEPDKPLLDRRLTELQQAQADQIRQDASRNRDTDRDRE